MKISVLMSVYNESNKELDEAILSILRQSLQDFELIIVNDDPVDVQHQQALQEWAKRDKRIILVQNDKNIGLAASMNKALRLAHGEYIARMDADDISLPTRFQVEMEVLDKEDCDVVFSDYIRIDSDGRLLENGKLACSVDPCTDLAEQIVFNGIVHHPTVMMKREALKQVDGYRLFPCSQDQDLWIRMLENGAKFKFVNEALLYYRVRENSISQKKGYQQYLTIQYILCLLRERSLYAGHDSFSVEEYENYISERMKNIKETDRYSLAVQYLQEAKIKLEQGNKKACFAMRCSAFFLSSALRKGFLFKLQNRNKILKYLKDFAVSPKHFDSI